MGLDQNIKLREELSGCKRLVIKVGSNVVTRNNGKCDLRKMRIIVEDICELVENGFEIVLVSSGAFNVGKAFLKKMLPRKGSVDLQQSASSIGQPKLINKYSQFFEDHQHICSQILLTHDDFRTRHRFLHAKKTIEVLLKNKITPILNENDTISYTENTVGDNDHLAASAAQMVHADALIIITSAKGLYDRDPSQEGAKLIKTVNYGDELEHVDMSARTSVGRGGMESKVQAVNKVTPLGIRAVISSKDSNRIVMDAITKNVGTIFGHEQTYSPEQKKAWIISTKKLNCWIEVDKGAYEALLQGHSLFSKGIVASSGEFFQGDCVDIIYNNTTFAVGICEYNQTDVDKIKNVHSKKIEEVLGFKTSSAVILTDNLVLLEEVSSE